MKPLEIIILVIWILAMIADFVVCLQKHKNNKADYAFYKKSMYFVAGISALCAIMVLIVNAVSTLGMYILVSALVFFIGMFFHWLLWSTSENVYKRQS